VIAEILQSEDAKPEYVMEIVERLLGVVDHVGMAVVGPYLARAQPYVMAVDREDLQKRRQRFLEEYAILAGDKTANSEQGID
jgi:hypothetical protein